MECGQNKKEIMCLFVTLILFPCLLFFVSLPCFTLSFCFSSLHCKQGNEREKRTIS